MSDSAPSGLLHKFSLALGVRDHTVPGERLNQVRFFSDLKSAMFCSFLLSVLYKRCATLGEPRRRNLCSPACAPGNRYRPHPAACNAVARMNVLPGANAAGLGRYFPHAVKIVGHDGG